MQPYLDVLRDIMENGQDRPNRTGTDTRSKFGVHMSFDLTKGFPAVTTKKLAFNQVKGELLGFIRGYDNAADFRALGCNVWDANANAPAWQANASCKGPDDLGRIYGVQWRKWKTHRPILGEPTGNDIYPIMGYGVYDQLADVIRTIKTNPYDRRLIVSAWNAAEIADKQMALPPCHIMFQFYPDPERKQLSLAMYQRSCDMFLGVPFNIASYALLLCLVAYVTNYKPHRFEHFLGDAHIYHNHFDQVTEQLSRQPLYLPNLVVQYRDTIDRFEPPDIQLKNYEFHPALSGAMAV